MYESQGLTFLRTTTYIIIGRHRELMSSFLTAHQLKIGHSVP